MSDTTKAGASKGKTWCKGSAFCWLVGCRELQLLAPWQLVAVLAGPVAVTTRALCKELHAG